MIIKIFGEDQASDTGQFRKIDQTNAVDPVRQGVRDIGRISGTLSVAIAAQASGKSLCLTSCLSPVSEWHIMPSVYDAAHCLNIQLRNSTERRTV
ncbi:MAG: hypothetical protein MI975_13670 [Cytophagales bacterium]|nr:hypothetical protein [Cytophagales bacterium]